MKYPLAWYLTWTTYGTWLHGDARGSNDTSGYILPNPQLEAEKRAMLTESPVFLSREQRRIVEAVIVAECKEQQWALHAINPRTNHIHVVLSANRDGEFLRVRLKAIASAVLSDQMLLPMAGKDGRRKWWTEKGNIVEVETEEALAAIIIYVRDLQ